MNLLKLATGGLLDKVIDKVLPDKLSQEDRIKLKQEFDLEVMANENKIEEYRRDIIVADSKSEDSYVRYSRPTLFYVIYLTIIFNYMIIPLVQTFKGVAIAPIELPPKLWELFTIGYLGYSGFRTFDKHSNNKHGKK